MIKDDFTITQELIDYYRGVFDNSKTKPEIEQALFDAQNEWLLDRDNLKKRGKFLYLMDGYARSAVLNLLKESEGASEWEVSQIVDDTCRRMLKLYTRNHDYVIGTSFWTILLFKAKEALSLFRHNKKHNSISIDTEISTDAKKSFTLMDLLAKKEAAEAEYKENDKTAREALEDKLQAGFDYLYANCDYFDMIDVYKVLYYSYERIINISLKTKQKIDAPKAFCMMNKVLHQCIDSSQENYLHYRKIEAAIVGFLKAIRDN